LFILLASPSRFTHPWAAPRHLVRYVALFGLGKAIFGMVAAPLPKIPTNTDGKKNNGHESIRERAHKIIISFLLTGKTATRKYQRS